MKEIKSFELDSWGNVKIKTRTQDDRVAVTHEYYNVPRDIIKWFINLSKAPDLKDFDDKIKAHHDKTNEKYSITESTFWSNV